ncbi:MAG: lysophospholipid acyltransferase family protein [Desulfatibacillaceae bacterium]
MEGRSGNVASGEAVTETVARGERLAAAPTDGPGFLEMLRRRVRGEYSVDQWGADLELMEQVWPLSRFFYEKYWRVTTTGIENVPAKGRALLVANHSGVLPYDGAMVIMSILEEHPEPRFARALHLSLFSALPVCNVALTRMGQVQALPENSERLLERDELVLVFPEGAKGIGKPYRKRYQLARFGRGGFVRVALKTGTPIIPVSIVGAEEVHPMLANIRPLAQLLGIPYWPVTPTFPWLGPLGLLPLPTKWYIHFDEPIHVEKIRYRPAEEPLLVSKLSSQVRDVIQKNIHARLKTRRAVFW